METSFTLLNRTSGPEIVPVQIYDYNVLNALAVQLLSNDDKLNLAPNFHNSQDEDSSGSTNADRITNGRGSGNVSMDV